MPDKDQKPIGISEEIPKEFLAPSDMLTEDELFRACKERAKEFDAPPDEPPGLFSNFIKWWEEQNAIAMSKEIPLMATVWDLRDLRLEDIGLLAFLGSLHDDHDGDVESVASLLGRTDSDIHASYDRLRRCGLLSSSEGGIWHTRMKTMVL